MPQIQLPIFPDGLTLITPEVGFQKKDGQVVYFNGQLPVFQHAADDIKSFRLFTSNLVKQGTVSQMDIVKAFGVPQITVKRYVKLLGEKGNEGFYTAPKRRSAPVLTPEMVGQVQLLLDAGKSVPEVAQETKVRADTMHKAIRAGRLKKRR